MTPLEIIAAGARSFGVSPRSVLSERKSRTICLARKAAIWVLRTRRAQPPSFPAIGRHLGRGHPAIIHAFRDAERLREVDPGFRCATDRLLFDALPAAPGPGKETA